MIEFRKIWAIIGLSALVIAGVILYTSRPDSLVEDFSQLISLICMLDP
ncbi:MAG: hypothetical protein UT86_C0003G0002 [Candidatus Magasanikbacteria bacterium GW2011_GWC2_40_17]|nr:MAG: hypothetical protein UT86_C0003G0002 [Candidatus Magasanikbacteria bacterium GW2011_GWC2_40_17]